MTLEQVVAKIKEVAEYLEKTPQELTLGLLTLNGLSERQLRRHGGLNLIKAAHFPDTNKDLASIVELKSEKKYVASLETKLGKVLSLEDKIVKALEKLPKIQIKEYIRRDKKEPLSRAVNVIFSDLHIGSDIKEEETGSLDFGRLEESRRLARLTKEIVEFKSQYRDQTTLNLFLLGDVIQNHLHDPRDGAELAEQCARAIYLLSQSIGHMAANFPQVTVYCATGNHGRDTGRHHGRAVNQKWDSIETVIYYALKETTRSLGNVDFIIPKTPYTICDVFGKKIFLTHGDSVLAPGYPNKAIQTAKLEVQINKINASLPDHAEYAVFIVGHVHCGSMTHLANGAVMITNGAMVPSDEFAVSIGLLENTCGQWVFESVENYPVGDSRFIKVSQEDDKDVSLDKIIKPFEGL